MPARRRADSTSSIAASSKRTGASPDATSPISAHCAGVAFVAEGLAHHEFALFFGMATAPDEIGEALRDEAGREEVAAFVGVGVVGQRGDDVGSVYTEIACSRISRTSRCGW